MIKYTILAILLIITFISDTKTWKVKNNIIVTFLILTITLNIYEKGINGAIYCTTNFIIPILILFPLFALKIMGAGDIKLFGVIGAIMGYEFCIYSIAYSFICGGIIGVIIMFKNKILTQRIKYFMEYIKICLFTGTISSYNANTSDKKSYKFRFVFSIICGVISNIIIQF